MAVTFGGVGGAIVVSSTIVDIVLAAPSCVAGDILIAVLLGKDNIDHTGNANFTELGTQNNNTTLFTTSIWWKRAVAADSLANFTFSKATDNNLFFAGVMFSMKGAGRAPNPFTACGTPTVSANALADAITYATFDPAIACHIIAVGFYNDDLTTPGTISGTDPTLTNRVDLETGTGTDCSIFVYDGYSSGAATGARSHATTSTADALNTGWLFGIEEDISVMLGRPNGQSGERQFQQLLAT